MSRFSLRPYQYEFTQAVARDLSGEFQRVLGVAATGAGKTIIASELMDKWEGNCLFLADAKELVRQNRDKFQTYTGKRCGVEMAEDHATADDRVVVGTMQSMARRLDKWCPDHFRYLIVDEAHRNTLGEQAQGVLEHFGSAQVLGVTATPFRSDRKNLGDFYEKISCEIGLVRLIQEGYLSRIIVEQAPLPIDLSGVRTSGGDYRDTDLGDAVEPHLLQAANLLKEKASGRKTVAFLPLVETSKAFTQACREVGLRAVHVDGKDRTGLAEYEAGRADVISCASLLTTGWDSPKTDCVYVLRPTKSLTLYQQMVGRGTRIADGKENLLLLDPLYLVGDHNLITPARLVAKTTEEANALQAKLGLMDDLLDAHKVSEEERISKLQEELERKARRKAQKVDAIQFCLSLSQIAAAEYRPELQWEKKAPTEKQANHLARAGFDLSGIKYRGHASKILDLLFTRRTHGLATPKQVIWLRKLGHPTPEEATFKEAGAFLSRKFGR